MSQVTKEEAEDYLDRLSLHNDDEEAESGLRRYIEQNDASEAPVYAVGFRRPDGSTEIYDLTPAFKESKIRDELIRHGWTPPGLEEHSATRTLT